MLLPLFENEGGLQACTPFLFTLYSNLFISTLHFRLVEVNSGLQRSGIFLLWRFCIFGRDPLLCFFFLLCRSLLLLRGLFLCGSLLCFLILLFHYCSSFLCFTFDNLTTSCDRIRWGELVAWPFTDDPHDVIFGNQVWKLVPCARSIFIRMDMRIMKIFLEVSNICILCMKIR